MIKHQNLLKGGRLVVLDDSIFRNIYVYVGISLINKYKLL